MRRTYAEKLAEEQSTTFVGRDFYVQPPSSNASAKEWDEWMRKDRRKRAGAKAAFTRKQSRTEPVLDQTVIKHEGVWRSQTPMAFNGTELTGYSVEPVQKATQEQEIDRARSAAEPKRKSGSRSRHRNARRKANRKARQQNVKVWRAK